MPYREITPEMEKAFQEMQQKQELARKEQQRILTLRVSGWFPYWVKIKGVHWLYSEKEAKTQLLCEWLNEQGLVYDHDYWADEEEVEFYFHDADHAALFKLAHGG